MKRWDPWLMANDPDDWGTRSIELAERHEQRQERRAREDGSGDSFMEDARRDAQD